MVRIVFTVPRPVPPRPIGPTNVRFALNVATKPMARNPARERYKRLMRVILLVGASETMDLYQSQ
jgi:hypothetical protein